MLLHIEITPKELKILTHFLTKEIDFMASSWLTATLAAIETVAAGSGTDPATLAAVATLQTQMAAVNVSDAEFQQAITALVTKLQVSTPPALPVITSISPATGPVAGGTVVTLTGTGFTGATAVNFGAVAGTALAVTSDTSLTVTSPALPAGTVDITVDTPAGTSATSAADQFAAS